jgi:hypothetical protein
MALLTTAPTNTTEKFLVRHLHMSHYGEWQHFGEISSSLVVRKPAASKSQSMYHHETQQKPWASDALHEIAYNSRFACPLTHVTLEGI